MSTLFVKKKKKVLDFLLNNPTKKIRVRELARELKLSPAHISRTLRILHDKEMIEDDRINLASPLVRALKAFINTEKLVEKDIIAKVKSLNVISAGVYGSWASGTNYEDSDLDVWIKVEKHPGEMKIASLVGEIRRKISTSVQLLVLTPERIKRLKKEDPIFYYSLVFGSMMIYGEGIE